MTHNMFQLASAILKYEIFDKTVHYIKLHKYSQMIIKLYKDKIRIIGYDNVNKSSVKTKTAIISSGQLYR